MNLGWVIDDRTFERRLLRLAREFERRVGALVDCDMRVGTESGAWATIPAIIGVMRAQNRPVTYREIMEYLPIAYNKETRWQARARLSYLEKRGLVRIHDYVEAYNNIWSPRFVLEEVAKGPVAERAEKIKAWFDAEVDELEARRMRRSCLAVTALRGSLGKGPLSNSQRNEEIIRLRSQGVTNRAIGKLYGVSGQRIDQIVQRAIKASLEG